jgi:hypothetical protein
MSVNDQYARVLLKVTTWDTDAGHGVVIDKQGFGYPVTLAQLGPEFKSVAPRVGEVLEGTITGPGAVRDIVDPKTERIKFDSVGANPDGEAIASQRGRQLEGGTPDTGLRGGKPHDGRFSDGRDE